MAGLDASLAMAVDPSGPLPAKTASLGRWCKGESLRHLQSSHDSPAQRAFGLFLPLPNPSQQATMRPDWPWLAAGRGAQR